MLKADGQKSIIHTSDPLDSPPCLLLDYHALPLQPRLCELNFLNYRLISLKLLH